MRTDDSVVIRTYANEVEAELAAAWLEAEGIAYHVMSDDAGGAYPMMQMVRGVKLLVSRADEARAREILENAGRETELPDPDADPEDRADDEADGPPRESRN